MASGDWLAVAGVEVLFELKLLAEIASSHQPLSLVLTRMIDSEDRVPLRERIQQHQPNDGRYQPQWNARLLSPNDRRLKRLRWFYCYRRLQPPALAGGANCRLRNCRAVARPTPGGRSRSPASNSVQPRVNLAACPSRRRITLVRLFAPQRLHYEEPQDFGHRLRVGGGSLLRSRRPMMPYRVGRRADAPRAFDRR